MTERNERKEKHVRLHSVPPTLRFIWRWEVKLKLSLCLSTTPWRRIGGMKY